MKITKDRNKSDIMLVGTESGSIKIYQLPEQFRRGRIQAHTKVVGFLTWDFIGFASAGSEGKLMIWTWIDAPPGEFMMPAPHQEGFSGRGRGRGGPRP